MPEPTKRCSTCGVVQATTEFNVRRKAHDGLQSRCRSCNRAWYAEHREAHMANVRTRNERARTANKLRMGSYLLVHPCVDCGETDIRVLDFDHDTDATKVAAVTTLVAAGGSWSLIEAEIAKCSVRCANCHRRVTSLRAQDWRHSYAASRRALLHDQAAARLVALLA